MCDSLTKSEIQVPQIADATQGFNFRSFGKDVLTYGFGQFLILVFGFINFLVVPKLLSVEDYGYLQLFMLYGSYVGILHFGFIDGILIRWAGKQLADVKHEIGGALKFLFIEQLLIIVPMLIISCFIDVSFRFIIISILIYAFFVNLTTFFNFTAQAVKKFKILTTMNVLRSISAIILIIIVLLFFGLNKYYYVIMAQIFSLIIILFFFILYFRKYIFYSKSTEFWSLIDYGKKNISIGIFVLLGNFSAVLLLTIDRLIVSTNFTINEFAIYAFALTFTGIIYIFISAISQVFFPHLAGVHDEKKNKLQNYLKPALIISWAAILTIYFPGVKFIEFYLPQYISSLPIMKVLLSTIGFGAVIQILQINYYKAYKKQKIYFFITIIMIGVSFLLNVLAITFFRSLLSVAGATLISFGLWFVINEIVLKKIIKQKWKELIRSLTAICCYIFIFFVIDYYLEDFLHQMIIYIILYIIFSFLFYSMFMKSISSLIFTKYIYKK